MSEFDKLKAEWASMAKVDPEVAFYLRNQAQIERWAALRERARPHVDGFYEALGQRLRDVAPAEVLAEDQASWSMLLWRQPTWPPTTGIGLCWQAGDLRSCFSGVRLEPGDPVIPAVLAHPLSQGALSSEYWTVWREEGPPPDLDLQAMLETVSARVVALWEAYAPVISAR